MPKLPTIPELIDSTTLASIDAAEGWIDYPLGDDAIDGDAQCKMKLLRTVGTKTPKKAVAFFAAEPSTFKWHFDDDEAFVLLEGHLAITLDTGERFEMRPGDAISVPGGHTGECEVFEPSRKFTVVTNSKG